LEHPKLIYDAHEAINWAQLKYFIIPTNVLDCHWILFVIDLEQQLIIVADSDSNFEYNCAIQQLLGYVGLNAKLNGYTIDFLKWNITYYNRLTCFVKQHDGSSCGPYVCQMAKAIIHHKFFQFTPNMARRTIARELSTRALIL
jgi:Ulp1 family protease